MSDPSERDGGNALEAGAVLIAHRAVLLQRHRRYREEVVRLARLRATPVCGMTSRAGEVRTFRDPVTWVEDHPPIIGIRRLSSYELAIECHLWARWLLEPWTPKPPRRPFMVMCWPDLGAPPDPVRRRSKARRS